LASATHPRAEPADRHLVPGGLQRGGRRHLHGQDHQRFFRPGTSNSAAPPGARAARRSRASPTPSTRWCRPRAPRCCARSIWASSTARAPSSPATSATRRL